MVQETSAQTPPTEMLLNMGATSHMFLDTSYFSKYTPTTESGTIQVGDSHRLSIRGRGNISFKALIPGGFRTVTLHDVQHVPGLEANLISLSWLQTLGA